MSHPLEVCMTLSYVIFYSFTGTFIFVFFIRFVCSFGFYLIRFACSLLSTTPAGRAIRGGSIFIVIFWRKSQIALLVFIIKILVFNN